MFNLTTKNKEFYFTVSNNDDDFIQITVPSGAYEIDSLNNEIKWIIFEERYFTEATYPFTIKPDFITLEFTKEISSKTNGSQIVFNPDDSIRDLLQYILKVLQE